MDNIKYDRHFLMDTGTVVEFVKANTDFFDAGSKLNACEIGDGNINYVFKVWDEATGKSLVVKQADKLLRSSGRPLNPDRNRLEAEALKLQGELAAGFVPKIYNYNENMYALIMEDISEYKNLRTELQAERIFENFPEQITDFLVKSLLPTTDLLLCRQEKKERVKKFINTELCDISEDLVFTEPYYDYKKRNIITDGMEEFVEEKLYRDEKLKAEVGYLRNVFMNNAEALIHGDLHSGSIFINESGIKIIDPEFAFYGPIGYDVGNVLGNLFFSWANKLCTGSTNGRYMDWIAEVIPEIYNLFKQKLEAEMERLINFPIYNKSFQRRYAARVMEDSLGFAGTELIRRTVGDAKVAEIVSVTEVDRRVRLEKLIISFGIRLIKGRSMISSGEEMAEEFKRLVKYDI